VSSRVRERVRPTNVTVKLPGCNFPGSCRAFGSDHCTVTPWSCWHSGTRARLEEVGEFRVRRSRRSKSRNQGIDLTGTQLSWRTVPCFLVVFANDAINPLLYIANNNFRAWTSSILLTMIFRKSPVGSSESIRSCNSSRLKEPRMSNGRLAFWII